jgi:hypothetical protein
MHRGYLFTGKTFAQSIIHPGRFGLGYEFGYSNIEGFPLVSNSVYVSTGKFDFYLSYADLLVIPKIIQYGSGGISYTLIRPGAWLYPTFHATYVGGIGTYLDLGASLSADGVIKPGFRVLPEIGADYPLWFSENQPGNSSKNISFYENLNFVMGGYHSPFYFTIAPGLEEISSLTVFDLMVGISIVP